MVNNGKLILVIEVTKKNCSFTLLLYAVHLCKKKTCIIIIEEYRMKKILIMELK